ncbi:cell division protein FtsK [Kitasatospora herbaricolor]|uniref:FtsK/SpoIIIE domain-containing protein n=1 Tax=Kitasatospora herbaricolor TaxID=68217 RepID=UPI00174CCB3C|nr:FtsK/SpoIIIE domain-containing protein [Kitasatospora herbaricolor]MDQ0309306.1 S-DNA-T family DNA segregation ATPase FtsK/SpoIIIE [Kitasatospora herbaricolor]GGV04311.1 cell division protein FtsK [Kitasatospora herbaricolor]
MNHDDHDQNADLFARLEADMATDYPTVPGPAAGGSVLDLDKARQRRTAPEQDGDADDSDDGPSVYVDTPASKGDTVGDRWATARAAKRRPIIPAWARSRAELITASRWLGEHVAHTLGYHAVRSPLYGAKLLGRAPRGTARLVGGTYRWVSDAESRPVRAAAVRREDVEQYLILSRRRDARVRGRSAILLLASLLGVAFTAVLLVATPGWTALAVAAALALALGAAGGQADAPLIDRAVVATKVQRLTSDIVVRALGAMGNAEINKAMGKGGTGITFPAPITRDGPGWRADIDLPYGVTAIDIIERRDRLASGLRRPMGCVWPEPVHDQHAGRLMLWVGDQDMSQVKAPAWPLAKAGAASLFRPLPFGTDQRGRPVDMTLMFANVLIGAMPRFGKTFALRVLMLAAALDPTAELHVWELKGTGDLEDAAKVAADYGSGADDDTIEGTVGSLRYVHKELERRAAVLRSLPKERRPENKVTPELAADRALGLHPLVLIIDECQELFSHDKFGKEAGELSEAIIKRGPAMGVILMLATQRPDVRSLPSGVSANVGIRFCLRVMGQTENDMVLGTSSYKNGLRATTFTANDKGIGYLVGAATDAQIVRSYYIDGPAAGRIMDRARAARITAGTLTGVAAGQAPERESSKSSLLDDLLSIWPAAEPKVWSETLVSALAALDEGRYGGWEPEQLALVLKPFGIDTVQMSRRIDGRQVNRRGVERDRITAAIAERDGKRSA